MLGESTSVSSAAIRRLSWAGMIDFGAERDLVGRRMSHIRLQEPSTEQVVSLLSDGDQQKIVLAKRLAAYPAVLIVYERTRGVDVGTQAEIFALTCEPATDGLAIPVTSSDLPEVLAISDGILVMRGGCMAGELLDAEVTGGPIMARAALEQAKTA